MGLAERMQGDQPLERLGANLLAFGTFLRAQVGAVFIAEGAHSAVLRAMGCPAVDALRCVPATA